MFAGIRKLWGGDNVAPAKDTITILYGSKSGNAEFVASETFRHLKDLGQKARLKNLSSYKAASLADESTVLFVVSTHGEGDPPPSSLRFFKQLNRMQEELAELNFSVCALGDSDYDHFCQAGRKLEKRLLELGARVFSERVDCDEAFEVAASGWISTVVKKLTNADNPETLSLQKQDRTWHVGLIRDKQKLNERAADSVYHICLSIDASTVFYRPGDSIGIIPQNPVALVDQILLRLNLKPDELVDVQEELSVREFLLTKAELTRLSRALLERYRELTSDENLTDLLTEEQACRHYCEAHDFLDLLQDFPYPLKAGEFPGLLDQLKVRYYSIASFQPNTPSEIHLTVKQLSFSRRNRLRQGACSNYLSEWLAPGTAVSFFVAPDDGFRLPADPTVPVIFIAAGTGIAPVRAFLTEREQHACSRNWLIFGAKSRADDFLYQQQLEQWKHSGTLEYLDLAFSRDQSVKVYVQDLMLRRGEELLKWIDAGAHIYVCGSIAMGRDVRAAIDAMLSASVDQCSLNQLIEDKRYCEDVY
ncbi:sulfite reductase flavoprotein subunit alpha [Mangrovibacterium marinum]|uniref:Sulfite reductase (NADPH) flavoprotein alpha-component n=1 Tax=Mangrovibacterium marinum TaxID=1639118 RepID=A0A2T5BSQ9_9BACT|nr:flavodoxin domain-containing protein [Mangrovibacterium marinum]PTN02421.1 sulfite reductase (NADPH) flavoprotein alpha-component [Mangrovibacterium marinum]